MQLMHCKKYLTFIEGTMERMFVNNNFPNVHVIPIQNGDSWTVESLAKRIVSMFKTKNMETDKIVVWLDRESQVRSSDEIRQIIASAFQGIGVEEHKLAIFIPDKMTENLILADEDLIRSEFGIEDYSYPGDGTHGKSELKNLYENYKKKKYKETDHGVQLLKKTHLSRACQASPPVQQLRDALPQNCWWNR
ncbi:DUF4276 family protein [Rhizobium helianthi]|uniref:DUF4276 family protein n=1 Tax=Rhizobium helianthi TaxID=1132695 RepID=A0ABW4M194_9HYPH